MALSQSLIETPMFDNEGRLNYAWIQKFSVIGEPAPVSALNYGTRTQRRTATKSTLPSGYLWYETDTAWVYRIIYVPQVVPPSPLALWLYFYGTQEGLAAARPPASDMGENDVGALYYSTDTGSLDKWDGTAWTSSAGGRVVVDTGATPTDSQVALSAAAAGALELLSYAADNQQILLDCSWEGGLLIAKDVTTARIQKNAGFLWVICATGQTVGTGVTGEQIVVCINLTSGKVGLSGNTNPLQDLDTTGNTNTSGAYLVAGSQVVHARMGAIAAPAGGAVIDVQARAAITSILNTLSFAAGGHGLTA